MSAVPVANVPVAGQMLSLLAMSFVGHFGYAAGGDPAIVEVEERAGSDGEVNGFVVPPGGAHALHIGGGESEQIAGNLRNEAKHGLVSLRQRRGLEIAEN